MLPSNSPTDAELEQQAEGLALDIAHFWREWQDSNEYPNPLHAFLGAALKSVRDRSTQTPVSPYSGRTREQIKLDYAMKAAGHPSAIPHNDAGSPSPSLPSVGIAANRESVAIQSEKESQ